VPAIPEGDQNRVASVARAKQFFIFSLSVTCGRSPNYVLPQEKKWREFRRRAARHQAPVHPVRIATGTNKLGLQRLIVLLSIVLFFHFSRSKVSITITITITITSLLLSFKMITPELLEALLSPDAAQRSHAETFFQGLNVSDRVQSLVTRLLANDMAPHLERLTAVLLRRDILKLTDVALLKELVSPLLQCYSYEKSYSYASYNSASSSSSKISIGHCLAEICATLSLVAPPPHDDEVSTVLPTILSCMEPYVSKLQVASLKLLATLADRAPVAFTNLAISSLPGLVQSIQGRTSVTPNVVEALLEVVVNGAIAAAKSENATLTSSTTSSTPLDELEVNEQSLAASLGSACLIPLLEALLAGRSDTHADSDAVRASLEHLSLAATTCPSLLAGNAQVLNALVKTCLQLGNGGSGSGSSDPTVQLTALQVVASLISVGHVKRRILPLAPELATCILQSALPACARLLALGVDDDVPGWASDPATLVDGGSSSDWDPDQALYAESLMESFLQHLGSAALTVVLDMIQDLLTDGGVGGDKDWRHFRGGLAMLECCLMATPVSLAPHLVVVKDAAISLAAGGASQNANANNIRVQWQAIRLLGALCATSDIRDSHGALVLERLAGAVSSPCSKVSALASEALVSYCRGPAAGGAGEELDAAVVLLPYLHDVLQALVHGPLSSSGMDTGSITTKVRAMGAVACLAQAADEGFGIYYASVMPGLLATAQLPSNDLAGAAIQAATIVGQAVGADLFAADAQQLLAWIIPVLQMESTNLPLDQLLSACARIASVLGEAFSPHVNAVLPHLLRRAQEPPDVSVVVRSVYAMCVRTRT
jgi:hypothetical protein